MRSLLLAALLLAGCSRPTPNTPAAEPALPATPAAVPQERRVRLTVTYKGMNAAEWAERLHDRDAETSRLAGLALSQIGEESVPFLLAGMDSPNAAVRLHSVGAFPCRLAKDHAADLVPRLKRFLKLGNDEWPTRLSAAGLAGRLPEMLPDLEAAVERETIPEFRNSMAIALKALRDSQAAK